MKAGAIWRADLTFGGNGADDFRPYEGPGPLVSLPCHSLVIRL